MRAAAARILGSPVVGAETQNGGFSPGSADRVVTVDGRRAFVKTAIAAHNDESARLHAREAEIVAALDPDLPVPAMIGRAGDSDWVVAVYEEIPGRHPLAPWRESDVKAVFDAFARIGAEPASEDIRTLVPTTDESLASWIRLTGWPNVADQTFAALPDEAWARSALEGPLGDYEAFAAEIRGDRLLHLDARADNILIRDDGSAIIIDWPHAAVGAAWVDPLSLLVDVAYQDPEADVRGLLGHRSLAGLSIETTRRFFFQLAGHFLANSQNAAPLGIPGLREFQRAEALTCLGLAQLLGTAGGSAGEPR